MKRLHGTIMLGVALFALSHASVFAAALTSITFLPGSSSATGTLYMNSSNELVFYDGTSSNIVMTQSAGVSQVPAAGITQGIFGSSVSGSNNQYIFKPTTNSTAMFVVQTAGAGTVLDVDTTNSRVGIGIAAPTATLHVNGTSQFADTVTLSAGKNIVFANSGVGGSQGGFQWALTNDNAYMYAREVTADQTDYYFKISDNTTADRFVWWITDYRGTAWDKYPLTMAGNYASFFNNSLYVENNATGTTAVGNVGIGTASPTNAKLQISGGGFSTQDSTRTFVSTAFNSVVGSADTRTLALNGVGTASMWWNGGGTPQFAIDSISGGGASFWTYSGGWNERMRVDSSGHVGIGNTNPANALDVTGSSTISGNLTVSGTITGTLSGSYSGTVPAASVTTGTFGSNASYRFNDSGGNPLLYTDATNGRVGISTATPTYELTVVDSSATTTTVLSLQNNYGTSANMDGVSIMFSRTGGSGDNWALITGSQQTASNYNYGRLDFGTRTSDVLGIQTKMSILADGKVGIGTTAPGGALDVASAATTNGYWLDGKAAVTGEASDNWLRLNASNSWTNGTYIQNILRVDGELRQGPGDAGAYELQTSGDLYVTGTAILSATSGSVGVGTTTPSSALHIYSANSSVMKFGRTGANTYGFEIGGTTFGLSDYTNAVYRWRTNGTDLILNESTGGVGVGTATPTTTARLSVSPVSGISADMGTGRIQSLGSPLNATDAATKNYVDSAVAGGSGSTVGYWTASSTDIYNSNSGNVGIGAASSPSYKLKVFGTFAADSGLLYTDNAGTLTGTAFYDRNNAAYFVDPSAATSMKTAGSVIIGGSGAPGATLDVVGTARANILIAPSLGTNTSGYGLKVGGSYTTQLSMSANTSANFDMMQNTLIERDAVDAAVYKWVTSHASFGSRGIRFSYGGAGSGITFFADSAATTAGATFTPTARMIIQNDGNVGIGTTSPGTNKLYVNGATYINGNLALGANNISLTGNISNVTKLTVQTIDPLYEIDGVKYATYAPSIAGGVKEEYVGRGKLTSNSELYEYIIDFSRIERGSDLWVWYQAVDFRKDAVEAFVTPYGAKTSIYYVIDGTKLIFRGDSPAEFSYRLIGKRHDWKEWPTYAKDQDEKASFTIKSK